jgi:hypothetical protein
VDLPLAMSATGEGALVLLVTGVVAPLIGLLLRQIAGGWETVGGGPFAIERELPLPRYLNGRPTPVDPAIQAAEVRQMLQAKSDRRQRQGGDPLDIEAETARLLAEAEEHAPRKADAALRAEVRQLVVARNERRLRNGEQPLDVEAETERQLADFIGSS